MIRTVQPLSNLFNYPEQEHTLIPPFDDDVIGAAKVLFGHSIMSLRNLPYTPFATAAQVPADPPLMDDPQQLPVIASDSSQPSSPDDSYREREFYGRYLDEHEILGEKGLKHFGALFSVSLKNKRKRKSPKRFESEDLDEEDKVDFQPVRKNTRRGRSKAVKAESPSPRPKRTRNSQSPGTFTEDEIRSSSVDLDSPSTTPKLPFAELPETFEDSKPTKRISANPKKTGRRCDYCGATTTPMWRHGPIGYNDLCNKCGVKWMRGRILPNFTREDRVVVQR